MGTSTSNPGQKGQSPLVPSWLNDDDKQDNAQEQASEEYQSIPPNGDPNRFRQPRTNYTKYINSGGTERELLRRATGQYIKSSTGGSRNAVTRLGSARASTVRLFGVLNTVLSNGTSNNIGFLDLKTVMSVNAADFFAGMVDYICPDGGPTDEGLVRDAFIDTIANMPELLDKNVGDLKEAELIVFMKTYMANIVFKRLLNDIGTKSISLPSDVDMIERIQKDTLTYIEGAVSDAFSKIGVSILDFKQSDANDVVDQIYETTYDILVEWGETE